MDVEQRARELLAAEYDDDPMMQQKVMAGTCRNEELVRAERAIIAALTPPDGYVLVPVELVAAIEDLTLIYEAGGDIDLKLSQVEELIAARPEVKP